VGILGGWSSCPKCGSPLDHHEGRVECAACGFVHYACSAPAVALFIRDESGRVLLARRAHEPYAGHWDTPGGFLDEGESPIAGIHREIREEAAVDVEVDGFVGAFVERYGDEPGAASVLNLVWEARIVAGEPMPADDVAEFRWFKPDALPADAELAFRSMGPALRSWASAGTGPH
jgi:8-oxo-dGTP diphosphatase